MATLVVASLSARLLAEAAADAGYTVLALDLFGDADTRRAARHWRGIGDAARLRIEAAPLCAALREAAEVHGAAGWIAGSGFEADPAVLDAGAALLPLIGNPGAVLRRLADARGFFARLDAHALPHPEVRHTPPADPAGWLLKDAAGCGGWQVRPARAADAQHSLPASACWQRRAAGRPVSATFVADGRAWRLLGCNQQRTQSLAGHPFVFAGLVGPVAWPPPAQAMLQRALDALVPAFGLRGLGSLDALLDGDQLLLLELNARPPHSLALYPRVAGEPVLAWHVRACQGGGLPPATPAPAGQVHGQAVVYARRAVTIDAALAARLARWPQAHDLPQPGTTLAAGDPVCSVGATGDEAAQVHGRLDDAVAQLLLALDTPLESDIP